VDVEAIHEGLASAVDGLVSSYGSGVKLRAYASLPGAINPPVFAPTEFTQEYHQTFSPSGGMTKLEFSCGVFSSEGDNDAGRKLLVGYLAETGSGSLLQAIEADKTLGGKCKTLKVVRVRGAYRLYTIGSMDYLGAIMDVAVWA
jgi:hypothetical protein